MSGIRSEYLGPSGARALGGAEAAMAAGKGVAAGEPPYYVKMGVAWAVSMFYIRFPKEIEAFLRRDRMDDFTHNKAIQKIRESRRVTPEEKARLNALKRK